MKDLPPRRHLPRSTAHRPLVEVTVEKVAHAWPNWQQFSPQSHQTTYAQHRSSTNTDFTSHKTPCDVGDASQGRNDGSSGGSGSCDSCGSFSPYGHQQYPFQQSRPQVSTVALLALAMCFGVCLVGLFGFLPIYFIGFRDVSAAVQMAQSQAVASMVASASTSVSRLPNIIKFALAAYMSFFDGALLCTRIDANEAIFYLSNVLGQERYRDFLTLVTGVLTGPGYKQLVCVSGFPKNGTLAAAAATGDDAVALYAVDDVTHFLKSPREPLLDLGIVVKDYAHSRYRSMRSRKATSAASEHNASVRTGRDLIVGSSMLSEVWVPWNYSSRFAYFSLMIPFDMLAEEGMCNCFVEGGLRTSYIANIIRDHFRYAIRQHGCYMMVDLARDLVVVNSWNQSFFGVTSFESGYQPFRMSDIEHPLMKAAVGVLVRWEGLRAVAERVSEMQNAELAFSYKGEQAILRVSPLHAPGGLDLIFVSVTVQSDFFTNIDRTLSALIYTMVAAVVATAVVSYVVAVYLRRAISHLTLALRASLKLQFPSERRSTSAPHSHFVELEEVRTAYARVQQQLMALKTVLPCSLLINEDEALNDWDDEVDVGSSIERRNAWRSTVALSRISTTLDELRAMSATSVHHRRGSANVERDSSGSESSLSSAEYAGGEQANQLISRVSRQWRQKLVLNTRVFNEKVNVFRKRYCTVVWICHHYTAGVDETVLDDFFKVVYTAALEFNGCIQALRPDYIVITFNAHTSLPMHAKLACELVLAIRKRVPLSALGKIAMLVDTNDFLVGTCGSENGLKSRVVFDAMHLHCIGATLREKGYHHVVVTQSTAKHLEYHETVPLDVVQVPFHEAPYTLYELRDASAGNIAMMQHTAGVFRAGFQQMREGDYVGALKWFTYVSSSDRAAQQLKMLCMKHIREDNKERYMSRMRFQKLRILSRVVHLRNTPNIHLFMVRMWKRNQVDGFFAAGPFLNTVSSSDTEESTHDTSALRPSLVVAVRDGDGVHDSDTTTASLAQVSSVTVVSHDRSSRRRGLSDAAEESSPSNAPSSDEREEALIEWISLQSASDMDDAEVIFGEEGSPTTATDSIPLSLLDSNGERWNRALRSDHSSHASTVYQAMTDAGAQVAIKFLPKRNRNIPEARLHNEIMLMSKLKHLNIVQYISYVWTATHIGIVMEYAPGGNLRDTIDDFGALPESLVRRYMVDILHGLGYLHRGGITHGDMKPHNILLGRDGVCKLSDFGSAVCEATDLARSNGMLEFRGTAVYTSPEVASGRPPTAASDVYSLGISFLEMLMGRLPWHWTDLGSQAMHGDCMTVREVAFVQAVGRGEIQPVISKRLSTAAQEFAKACCRPSPAERPTVSELLSFRFVL
jgi:hypothetical protein